MAKKKTRNAPRNKLKARKAKPLSSELMQVLQQAYALHQQGRRAEAAQRYQQILQDAPDHAETNFLFGLLIYESGHFNQSEQCLIKAVSLAPTEVRYLMGLGILRMKTGHFSAAEEVFRKANNLEPRSFETNLNLGTALTKLDRFSEAEQFLGSALKIRPDDATALNNMGNIHQGLCQIESSTRYYQRAFDADKNLLSALSNVLMNSHYNVPAKTPAELFEHHLAAGKAFPEPESLQHIQRPSKNRKYRIAYVSADFREHSVAYFLWPLLAHHDRENFEIYCYYNGDKVDQMTERFQSLSDHWSRVTNMDDAALTAHIRSHNIDLLIDLAGHTGNNRLSVFSRRAAPAQVSWLGYPHSTGLEAMDYRIVDGITDPEFEGNSFASEQLVRLPESFLCYGGDESLPHNPVPPAMENGHITFGSFNNFLKVNDQVIATWAEILKAVPDARILIKAKQLSETSVRERCLKVFEDSGISGDRVTLMQALPGKADHLDTYSKVDIALDTFPYNGTTTTCEALWMGVPTITFTGDRHAARVGASIMHHAGFPDFIAGTQEEFINLACSWASQSDRLAQIRRDIRKRLAQSTLCNAESFTRDMEQAFRQMITETSE